MVADGAISDDGQILGTYVHGIFDQPEALASLLAWSGVQGAETLSIEALREASLVRLAAEVETVLSARFLMDWAC